ncbi:MAG: sigma-70 family RNA polymerase sigma factor [Rhizobiaceae bacterium]
MQTTAPRERFATLAARVASQRDRLAFGELYDHFAPRILGYLMRLGLDRGASEELTQEVMVVLWQKADLFDPAKSSLSTWLFRVARNRRIDAQRRDKSGLIDPEDPFFHPEAAEPADQTVDADRRQQRISVAIAELPEDQRDLIKLAFFNGLSHSEIAAQTNLPLGTVKSRIRLAFARLRKMMEADPQIDTD